ncbi:MAG: hypothetical protein ACRC37_02955 [Lentisphaeria bacterium]
MFSRKISLTLLALLISQFTFAGILQPLKFWQNKRLENVIITANYTHARILTELIQFETKTPIILIASGGDRATKFYYLPYAEKDETLTAHEYPISTLGKFLDFLNPKKAVIIGQEHTIGRTTLKTLSNKTVPTVSINNDNWLANAEYASEHFKLKNLVRDYSNLLGQKYNITSSVEITPNNKLQSEPLIVTAPLQTIEPTKLETQSEVSDNENNSMVPVNFTIAK